MESMCTHRYCRFEHPLKKQERKEDLEKEDIINVIQQCVRDSMDQVKNEILKEVKAPFQPAPQHPRSTWDPSLV